MVTSELEADHQVVSLSKILRGLAQNIALFTKPLAFALSPTDSFRISQLFCGRRCIIILGDVGAELLVPIPQNRAIGWA
ncbi:hypothetical protein FME68_12940 [Corynebacterium aurimucosum]|uniref:Uncharacterized protein n=1 Tax=Corynebacterium aurimucosum TaxID=169292 RepID=A0A6I3KFD1_9CORY|nr:hypothetical protein [Corynebacterium aurimucosum]MTD92710.1 hypothetical protein [Corynebacterium aurimucosum]